MTISIVPNVHHPGVMRAILQGIVDTGDVLGSAGPGRTVLAVTVDDWLLDELSALGTDAEDHEPEPDEDDGLWAPTRPAVSTRSGPATARRRCRRRHRPGATNSPAGRV